MDPAEDTSLQKIEEFVMDEDKIVNYKWLSNILKVSIDSARSSLEKYVQQQRQTDSDSLGVWYVLDGIVKDTNEHVTKLVAEKNLPREREKYLNLYSDFIFIVSKSKLLDSQAICLSYDLQPQEKPVIGTFVSPLCTKRKRRESPKKVAKEIQKDMKVPIEQKSVNSGKPISTASKGKSGGISSFFSKGSTKSDSQSQKSASSQSSPTVKLENDNSQCMDESETNSQSDFVHSSSEHAAKPAEAESAQKQTKTKPSSTKPKGKKRDLSSGKKTGSASKRRKRIVVESDSEDDIFASDKDEADIEEDISRMAISQESCEMVVTLPPKKNKKRKLQEQTFTDSEGFIITKKEWIYESGEESEEELPQKKQNEKNAVPIEEKKPVLVEKKEKNSNSIQEVKGKGKKNNKKTPPSNQTTLMNFFQRK